MPRVEYGWEVGHPATLEPHSLAKHTILKRYIEEYVRINTQDPKVPELKLALIDGFAGGGEYLIPGTSTIHDGSPFILMDAVKTGQVLANKGRKKPVSVDASFIFVEKRASNFRYLEDALARRLSSAERSRVTAKNAAFEDCVDEIIQKLKPPRGSGRRPRPIFVLDQYGYSDVPIEMIAKIMTALPKAEVFLTLAFGWIGAYARGPKAQALRIQKSLHIAPHLQGFADGARDVEEIEELPPGDKVAAMRFVQQLLHEGFARQSEAMCYTPFFITSRESNRSYWFLHLANSPRANDAVKELHWKEKNHFIHFGGAGLMMLGYDPGRPPDDRQQQAFGFDKSALERTHEALLEQLPRQIEEEFPNGIPFDALYAKKCTETPASMEIMRHAVDELCRQLELTKRGEHGEERALATAIKDSDRISRHRNRAFSFIKKP